MHVADRTARTDALRSRLVGVDLKDRNLPSHGLTDKMATILARGHVKYVPWEACTSREQELLDEPVLKGLRLTQDGMLTQDISDDHLKADLSGDFMWDFALRRRSAAMDIAGLLTYEAADLWHQHLKTVMMRDPPAGYRKVSWSQVQAADQALFKYVATKCEAGTKAPPGSTITAFETAWKTGMFDIDVRQLLQFLPSGSSSSSSAGAGGPSASEVTKLRNQLKHQAEVQAGLKRKFEELKAKGAGRGGGGKGGGRGGGNDNGGGRGKDKKRGNDKSKYKVMQGQGQRQ